jgi:hypothetical protein
MQYTESLSRRPVFIPQWATFIQGNMIAVALALNLLPGQPTAAYQLHKVFSPALRRLVNGER